MFNCTICKFETNQGRKLEKHSVSVHNKISSFKCQKCGSIHSWVNYKRHIKTCEVKNDEIPIENIINQFNYENNLINSNENIKHFEVESEPQIQLTEDEIKNKIGKDMTAHLANIILKTKYKYKTTQDCINNMLFSFKTFLNATIELSLVNYFF